jgi:hypothetical protein
MKSELAALALKVFHVVWMAVGLALLLEVLILALALATGNSATPLGLLASVLSRVSWSVIVCAALAVTTALSRVAVPASGLAGLLVAPAATLFAKILQKTLTSALAGSTMALPAGVLLGMAALKGLEYLWLGAVLAWLGQRDFGFLAALAVGTVTGLTFGAAATVINSMFLDMSNSLLLVGFVNELLFPIGCSIILVGAEKLSRLMVPATA